MEGKSKPLMEMLIEEGYPLREMYHHGSDLYVFQTPLTTKVIDEWFRVNGYSKRNLLDRFGDQVTGKPMYDIAFQFLPYWTEKARKAK